MIFERGCHAKSPTLVNYHLRYTSHILDRTDLFAAGTPVAASAARCLPHHTTMALYPAPAVWAQAPGLSERTCVLNMLLGWCTKCRLLACPECKIHASRDIKLWHGHSCSLHQGARVLHAAAASHPCPSVAARLQPTQTITRFVLLGQTNRCSRPATGKTKSRGVRGIYKRGKLGKHLKHNPHQLTRAL